MGERVKKSLDSYVFWVSGLKQWFLTFFETSGSRFWRAGSCFVGSEECCYQANADSEGPFARD